MADNNRIVEFPATQTATRGTKRRFEDITNEAEDSSLRVRRYRPLDYERKAKRRRLDTGDEHSSENFAIAGLAGHANQTLSDIVAPGPEVEAANGESEPLVAGMKPYAQDAKHAGAVPVSEHYEHNPTQLQVAGDSPSNCPSHPPSISHNGTEPRPNSRIAREDNVVDGTSCAGDGTQTVQRKNDLTTSTLADGDSPEDSISARASSIDGQDLLVSESSQCPVAENGVVSQLQAHESDTPHGTEDQNGVPRSYAASASHLAIKFTFALRRIMDKRSTPGSSAPPNPSDASATPSVSEEMASKASVLSRNTRLRVWPHIWSAAEREKEQQRQLLEPHSRRMTRLSQEVRLGPVGQVLDQGSPSTTNDHFKAPSTAQVTSPRRIPSSNSRTARPYFPPYHQDTTELPDEDSSDDDLSDNEYLYHPFRNNVAKYYHNR